MNHAPLTATYYKELYRILGKSVLGGMHNLKEEQSSINCNLGFHNHYH
jgi:hypothetical protein